MNSKLLDRQDFKHEISQNLKKLLRISALDFKVCYFSSLAVGLDWKQISALSASANAQRQRQLSAHSTPLKPVHFLACVALMPLTQTPRAC